MCSALPSSSFQNCLFLFSKALKIFKYSNSFSHTQIFGPFRIFSLSSMFQLPLESQHYQQGKYLLHRDFLFFKKKKSHKLATCSVKKLLKYFILLHKQEMTSFSPKKMRALHKYRVPFSKSSKIINTTTLARSQKNRLKNLQPKNQIPYQLLYLCSHNIEKNNSKLKESLLANKESSRLRYVPIKTTFSA